MPVYVGIDVHRKRSQVTAVTEDGTVQPNKNTLNARPVLPYRRNTVRLGHPRWRTTVRPSDTDRRLRAFVMPVGNPHVRTPSAPFCAHEVIGRIALIASGSRMDSGGWLAAHDVTALVVQAAGRLMSP